MSRSEEIRILPKMTEKQAAHWPKAIERARKLGAEIPDRVDSYGWYIIWQDETRPGRGHHLDAVWLDGEHLVQIRMDVYGFPSVSVATTELIHSDSDEECRCDPLCLADRLLEETS